jgi:hypothetical protein
MVLALYGSNGGIARTEKEVQKLKLNLHSSEKRSIVTLSWRCLYGTWT